MGDPRHKMTFRGRSLTNLHRDARRQSFIVPSYSQSNWPLVECLRTIEIVLGSEREWTFTNDAQTSFLSHTFSRLRDYETPLVDSATFRHSVSLQEWFAARGLIVSIHPFGSDGLGVASVLDVLLTWIDGTATQKELLALNGQRYPGVEISSQFRFYSSDAFAGSLISPVIEIQTQDPSIKVCFLRSDAPSDLQNSLSGLIDLVQAINARKVEEPYLPYDRVHFPRISLEETRTLDWMHGLSTMGGAKHPGPANITQATRTHRLRMNQEGVRGQSVAGSRPYVIDQPYLFWITQAHLPEPLFVAWFNYDAWQAPNELNL